MQKFSDEQMKTLASEIAKQLAPEILKQLPPGVAAAATAASDGSPKRERPRAVPLAPTGDEKANPPPGASPRAQALRELNRASSDDEVLPLTFS